jgi:RNA polymerase sigma factor (sigma-70 family)
MKNTRNEITLPTQEWHLQTDRQRLPHVDSVTRVGGIHELEEGSGLRQKAKGGRGKYTGGADIPQSEDSTGEDTFRIYLNEIGATELLSREEEWELGSQIRVGLNALLQHLLSSGRVGDMLLDQTRAELNRKNCDPAQKTALGSALNSAEAALCSARQRFVPGAVRNVELNAEVAAVLNELVSISGLWPAQGLDVLSQLEDEFSHVFEQVAAKPASAAPEQFERVHLMDRETCESFLEEGKRLRSEALAARNKMVAANLRLVVSVAKKITQAFLSVEDLVQEGNFGLIKAAERFDERLGHRFSTFAVRLIKSAMRRENDNQGRTIRLPVHRCDALRKLEEARGRIESACQKTASVGQLSAETGFSDDEVRELIILKQGTISLHQETGDDGELTLEARLPDPGSLAPFYGENEQTGRLDPYLQHLAEAQRAVVTCMYGIGGCPQLTLEETADTLGLTRVQVRSLHQSALGMLRSALAYHACPAGYAHAA